ncbi:MAG: ABC transporter ATP-binding protein [Nitrososphaerota archaeon]
MSAKEQRSSPIILDIKNISKEYKSSNSITQTIFDGMDLKIREGEFVTIIGKSGCGKSTLLNIVAGLDKSFSGEVIVEGKPVKSTSQDRIVIFQENALFPWLNVVQNIEFSLRQGKIQKERRRDLAMNYLNMVGLSDFAEANVHELSGGMKQRVAIARALSLDPKFLLMDEPFAALDIHTRQSLCSELLRIHHETKKTILFVTHNIDEAVLLGDRVILISHSAGKIRREFIVNIPRPRDLTHLAIRNIVSEVMDELRESSYRNKDLSYATTISI